MINSSALQDAVPDAVTAQDDVPAEYPILQHALLEMDHRFCAFLKVNPEAEVGWIG